MGVSKSLSIENAAAAQRYLARQQAERVQQQRLLRERQRQRRRLLQVGRTQPRSGARASYWAALAIVIGLWVVV